MKKCLLLLVLIPMVGFSQTKNVLSVERIFAKADKAAELEKALAAHSQKYHTGNWKWRVSQIDSGPEAGGYAIAEGPNSWTDLDSRGNLGAEHMTDWTKNVMPLTTGTAANAYMVLREDLSSVQLTDYADKISVTHVYPKVGWTNKIEARLKKAKKVWETSGESVAVYQAHFSGEPQFMIVYRHKQGLKEKEANFRKPFMERYTEIHGEGSFDEYLESVQKYVDKTWGEMLSFRADLSSK